jgi:hypothetical protein
VYVIQVEQTENTDATLALLSVQSPAKLWFHKHLQCLIEKATRGRVACQTDDLLCYLSTSQTTLD